MSLTAIIGPMKSGKSLELIARLAPYKFANESVVLVQPIKNVRDEGVQSRIGLAVPARKVTKLSEVEPNFTVIGVDEVHMFEPEDIAQVEAWLLAGKVIILSGLDTDYQRRVMPVMERIYSLKPDTVIDKLAVCDRCKLYNARFTAILKDDVIVRSGLPSVVPDDGVYTYLSVCRQCFVAA